jgi:ribosomal protein S18 acetylase RimI-like enzyme
MIGYCVVIFDEKNSSGFIARLAVLPEYQHRGIGSELLKHAVHQLQQNKCEKIRLSIWKDEDQSLNLYTQFGFEIRPEFTTRIYNLLSVNQIT